VKCSNAWLRGKPWRGFDVRSLGGCCLNSTGAGSQTPVHLPGNISVRKDAENRFKKSISAGLAGNYSVGWKNNAGARPVGRQAIKTPRFCGVPQFLTGARKNSSLAQPGLVALEAISDHVVPTGGRPACLKRVNLRNRVLHEAWIPRGVSRADRPARPVRFYQSTTSGMRA